jgi:ribonuclease HI|tara:strand:- start:221 stop:655 length:435 start_codon:yes stop_codon:yes gene_type:complete
LDKVTFITDGACSGNPGPGGWCVIIKKDDKVNEFFGGDLETTNNKMELTAVIKGFENLNNASEVLVKTDSTYVINGITKWLPNWKAKGWINSAKKPVANKDLWEQLESLISNHKVDWLWVKGHSGDDENERADELARKGLIDNL